MAGSENRTSWLEKVIDPGSSTDETSVLTGRRLDAVRTLVMTVFVTAVVFYTFDLFAMWDEAHSIKLKTPDAYDTTITHNFLGLTVEERELLTGSTSEVPGWYPVFVVSRQLLLDVVALGIAWLIFSRRPRHWMAYLSTLFIIVGPWLGHLIKEPTRLDDSVVRIPSIVLGIIGVFTLLSFLWLFPDGRFRRPFLKFLAATAIPIVLVIVAAYVIEPLADDGAAELVAGIGFLAALYLLITWGVLGVAVQIWRYNRTKQTDRRLARWNLAFLIAVPLWFLPFDALHDLFSDSDVGRYTVGGFVWEQIHETLYLAAPVLMGIWVLFLVRRQGWWDFQTLWNRTAVYGIGLLLLAGIYGAMIGVVTVAASPLSPAAERAVAVMAATAAVAFAYGPLLGWVRAWVDERWFPRRADVEARSAAFASELRASPDPGSVSDHLRRAVAAAIDPEHIEVWTVRAGDPR